MAYNSFSLLSRKNMFGNVRTLAQRGQLIILDQILSYGPGRYRSTNTAKDPSKLNVHDAVTELSKFGINE